jgi:hypothetical protein
MFPRGVVVAQRARRNAPSFNHGRKIMRKVLMLLGVIAFAAPAWADDAVPQRATDVVSGTYALPAPYVVDDEVEFSEEFGADSWTGSGENSAQDGFACYCGNNNGRARCIRDGFCNDMVDCNNGQCPQGFTCWVDSCCGVPKCFPDNCIQDPACQRPGTCGAFQECSQEPPGNVTFYRDPREFALAVERAGKRNKGTENFEESTTGPNQGVPINDPLEGGVGNPPHFPNGLAVRNLRIQSNTLAGNPDIPSPRGANALAHFTPNSGGFTTKVIIANTFVDSLDLIFKSDPNCDCKTAVAGNTVRFTNAGASDIRVYDVNNNFLGQANGIPSDPAGTNFIGVISNGPCIGRINLFDPNNGAEGLDNIQMWCHRGEEFTCEAVANKAKKAKNCQGACPPLPPQKTNRPCDPPGPNPSDCPPGLKIKGKVKGPCPGNPTGCTYKKFKLNGVCDP